MTDQVIDWAQDVLEHEYLVDGKLRGASVAGSRAPQRYGFGSLDEVVRETYGIKGGMVSQE
jgi:hypothetical protein